MGPLTLLDIVVDAHARAGCERVFAVHTSALLLDAAGARNVDVVAVPDVTAACVMAAATGELTGTPGVVVVEAYEPATRAALDLARVERSPVICVGPAAGGVLDGVAKAAIDATAVSAARGVRQVLDVALARPRGPVCLALAEAAGIAVSPVAPAAGPVRVASGGDLDRVAAAIRGAEHPVVLAGVDARDAGARAWVRAFAESLPAPVVTTWKAKGAMPDPHPLVFGVATASEPAAELLERADLLIALGVDDAEREVSATPPLAVWLGPDAADVAGDLAAILADLAPRLQGTRADWDVAELDRMKRRLDMRGADRVRWLVALAREAMPAGTIATFDATLRDAAASWDCVTPEDLLVAARSTLSPFALPAAVAASLAFPVAAVLCFTEAAQSPTTDAAISVAVARSLALGVIAVDALDHGLPRVPLTSEPALALALGRLLSERRPLLLDARPARSAPSV